MLVTLSKVVDKKYLALIPKGKKRDTIRKYASELEGKIHLNQIAMHMSKVLNEYVNKDYVRECLDKKYKVQYRVDNAKKRKFVSRVSHARPVSENHIDEKKARAIEIYKNRSARALNEEESEILKQEIKRRHQVEDKVDWNNPLSAVYSIESYSEEECRIILRGALYKLSTSSGELKQEKKAGNRLFEENKRLKEKYKICEICDKKAAGKYMDGKVLYCKKHLRSIIQLNKDMAPMVAKSLIGVSKILAKHNQKKKTQFGNLRPQ